MLLETISKLLMKALLGRIHPALIEHIFAMLADEGGLPAPTRGAVIPVVDHVLAGNNLRRFAAGVVLPDDISLYCTTVAPFFPRRRVRAPARAIGHAVALMLSRLCTMCVGLAL